MSNRQRTDFKITDPAEMAVTEQPPVTTHPGVFLRETILPQYGLKKIAPIAEMIGFSRPNLSLVLNGHADITRDLAYRFGALLNDHVADFLISYQAAWDKQKEAEKREAYKQQIERVKVPEPAA